MNHLWGNGIDNFVKQDFNWTDRVLTIIGIIVTILTIKENIYALLLIALIIIVVFREYFKTYWLKNRKIKKEKKAMDLYSNKFMLLVSDSSEFMSSVISHSLPYYYRSYLTNTILPRTILHDYLEGLFSVLSHRLEERLEKGWKTYSDFNEINHDLFKYLEAYHRIYIISFTQMLNEPSTNNKLNQLQKNEINLRIDLFRKYVQDYNTYRKDLCMNLGESLSYILPIPTENIV